MSTAPASHKENDGLTTPQQQRRPPPSNSVGRTFGSPLTNCGSVVSTSALSKEQQRQSSSKKLVRARKLVQQHKSPPPPRPSPPPSLQTNNNRPEEYTVHFLPGPIGLQLEPAQGPFGCRVACLVDGAPDQPGQARLSRQIQPGDILWEVNDDAVFHKEYDDIIDMLRELANKPRNVLFRRGPPFQENSAANETHQMTTPKESMSISFAESIATPVVSPRIAEDEVKEENTSNSQSKQSSSVLFLDPDHVPSREVSSSNANKISNQVPTQPSLPLVTLGTTPSQTPSGDVVLDMNNISDSIDSSSTITPSKVKNLSQEDVELGLGGIANGYQPYGKKPLSNVLKSVYNNVVVGLTGGQTSSQDLEESFYKKSQMLQHLNNASLAMDSRNQSQSSHHVQSEKELLAKQFQNTLARLHQSQMNERDRQAQLEMHLTEANARVAELTVALRNQEADFDRRLQLAHEEAMAREYRLSQMQLTRKTDLETKLLEAECKIETLTQQKAETKLKFELDLQAAAAKVREIVGDKEELEEALHAVQMEMDKISSTANAEKSCQYESQLQIAKLQTELREEKKQNSTLKTDLNQGNKQLGSLRSRMQEMEKSLHDNQEELAGTKCMMETYEERFIEREKDVEALQEEKEFAGRELWFVRSEIERLEAQLEAKDESLASTRTAMEKDIEALRQENQRLQENIAMAQTEFDDQKQNSYNAERSLQTELAQRSADLHELQKELKQLKIDSTNEGKALQSALDKRDADLALLNKEIDTHVTKMRQELQSKEQNLINLQEELRSQNEITKEKTEVESELRAKLATAEEQFNSLKTEKLELQKEAQELKDLANEVYFEKCRITKELQAVKVELSDSKIQHTKIQDAHLQRAKQMDAKAKEAQNELKQKESELAAVQGKFERANVKIESLNAEMERLQKEVESSSTTIKLLEEEREQVVRREYHLKIELEEKEGERKAAIESLSGTKSKLFESNSRISYLERQISDLDASKNMSDQELAALKAANENWSRKVESLREEVDSKDSALSAKSLTIMTLETSIDNLHDEAKQRMEEVESLQKSLADAQSQYTQVHERFVNATEESSRKIQSLTSDLISAQDELAENQKACSKLEQQVASTTSQLQKCEGEIATKRSQLEHEKQKVNETLALSQSAKHEFEMKTSDMKKELEGYRAYSTKLEQECSERSKENANLKLDISGLEKKLSSTRSLFGTEQSKYRKEHMELEDLLESQKAESKRLSDELNANKSELTAVNNKVKDMERAYDDRISILRHDLNNKCSKIEKMKRDIEESDRACTDLREELNVAKLDVQRVDESRRRSREEVEHLSIMIDELRTEHESQVENMSSCHKDEMSRLTKEKDEIEASLRRSEEAGGRLHSRLEEAENVIAQERDKNEELLMDQDGLTSNLHRAEDLVAELRCELQVLREEQANESFDSIDSQTLALSKRELRVKCKHLAEELQEAETRAAEARSGVTQRTEHIRSLECDMTEMSAELERMVETSEQLEQALMKARTDKAASDNQAEELRASIEMHQAKTQALKEELDQQYNENSGLYKQMHELQQKERSAVKRETGLQQEIEKLREAMMYLEEQHKAAKEEMTLKVQELSNVQDKKQEAEDRLSELEFQIAKLQDQLDIAEREKERIQTESGHTEERLKEQLRELGNECTSLRSSISNLENDMQDLKRTIHSKEEVELSLYEKLEKERAYGLKMENLREEAVTKLAEASRVLAAQKGIIKVHEARAVDAESRAQKFSEQVNELQESIQSLESKTEETGNLTQSQICEMEKKRAALEKARQEAKAEAESLRDEVRQANRKANELERLNKSLQTRIEELKTTAEATKAQLREARTAWADSDSLSRSLENDLQSSRAEIDHLRAKLQLCGATIARLKSDRILLQEQAMQQNSGGNSGSDSAAHELSQLRSELHTKASQLSSASASLRNYKKATAQMKQSEQQLFLFIDEIIVRTDATFVQLSKLASELQMFSVERGPNGGSAHESTPQKVFDDANCCVSNFVKLVQETSAELKGKRKKLDSWKNQNKHLASTPSAKSNVEGILLSPNDTTVYRAFHKMKEIVEDKIGSTSSFDSSQVENVILSLENQIEALCFDLKQANNALRSKDKLFAELEQKLQELETSKAPLTRSERLSSIPEESKTKAAAVRMAAKVFESHRKVDASCALRKWSTSVASCRTHDAQKFKAEALAAQLEATRDKLTLLKTHFKRRGNDKALEILEDSAGPTN